MWFLLLGQFLIVQGQAQPGVHHYLYLSNQRVITVELIDEQKAILNYINLGETFEMVQAPMLLILDSEGNVYRGHLMEIEDSTDPVKRFQIGKLIKPREYEGFDILGNYRFTGTPRKAFLRLGTRIIALQSLSPEEFELAAAKIGGLDLAIENGRQMVMEAGFRQGHGTIYNAGDEGIAGLEKYFPDLDLLAPVVLSEPKPALPLSFAHLPDPVTVLLKAVVSQTGGLFEVEVAEGIDPTLDEMARQTVSNSWTFLPAISKGEISPSEVTLEVVFQRD